MAPLFAASLLAGPLSKTKVAFALGALKKAQPYSSDHSSQTYHVGSLNYVFAQMALALISPFT